MKRRLTVAAVALALLGCAQGHGTDPDRAPQCGPTDHACHELHGSPVEGCATTDHACHERGGA